MFYVAPYDILIVVVAWLAVTGAPVIGGVLLALKRRTIPGRRPGADSPAPGDRTFGRERPR